MSKRRLGLAVVFIVLVSGLTLAQFGGGRGGGFRSLQNPDTSKTEFIFARWHYAYGSGWTHDYPDAEEHINQIMSEATGVDVDQMSYKIVPMESDEIFKYPFGYISEPGQMDLTDAEVKNFREFVDRGGFVMLDDFDSASVRQHDGDNIQRVFPDRRDGPHEEGQRHHILRTPTTQIDSLYMESPYDVGGEAEFFGINDEEWHAAASSSASITMSATIWEHIDKPDYKLRPSAEAFGWVLTLFFTQ